MNASIKSFLAAALGCLLLAACGQSAAPAGSSGPNAASSGAASSQTSAAWQQVVADGRREGTLNILAQGGTDVAKGLTESFQKLYPDIKIELLAGNGSEVASKLLTERAAGRYTSDLIVHGTTTIVSSLLPENALDPIVPLLTGPNDSDPSKWRTGNYNFADSAGKYDLIFTGGVHIPLIYSPSLASATDIPSFKSLLDPKWKGKIAMYDPRGAGSGLSMATLFYRLPGFGKDFLTQLFAQNVVFTREDRQLADWIARGQYAIGVAQQDFTALELKKKGVPLEYLPPEAVKEPTYLNSGWGTVAAINKAPHPNATKLYLDWLLSRDGQGAISEVSGYASRRLDAPTDKLADYVVPKPGVQYIDDASEENQRYKNEVLNLVKTLIPN